MSQTSTKKETQKELGINSHDDFNSAILNCQAEIESDPYPMLEVSPEFFRALTKGRDLPSITYGNPGVRVFKVGTMDDVLGYEDVPADTMRDREIKRMNSEKSKK